MSEMESNTIDAVVTDPPYGLSFMGKDWDHGIPGVPFWEETLRVCKPGAHMLAFGGTRTHHRLVGAIEDAGWEIRDCLMWVYGSGFPKSLDVSKAIDKAAGAEREIVGIGKGTGKQNPAWNGTEAGRKENSLKPKYDITAPSTPAAIQWNGWGTALKPAWEPIILARKPLEGTVTENVLKWGTGGLNIDGCRVGDTVETWPSTRGYRRYDPNSPTKGIQPSGPVPKGRFPANFIHDGSDEVLGLFPKEAGAFAPVKCGMPGESKGIYGDFAQKGDNGKSFRNDSGSAARFFYCAKASTSERNNGLDSLPTKEVYRAGHGNEETDPTALKFRTQTKNIHPTVKPVALLKYLCRLITPPNGTILDPFAGSGSTGIAAREGGFNYVLIEIEEEYYKIAKMRNAQVTL